MASTLAAANSQLAHLQQTRSQQTRSQLARLQLASLWLCCSSPVCVCVHADGRRSHSFVDYPDKSCSRQPEGCEERKSCFFFLASCLAPVVSGASGELLHPLMNCDCCSKVWVIEFPINYPEVFLRQISSSSSLLFFCGVFL